MNTSQDNLVATDDDDLGKSSSSQISNTDHTDLTSIPTDNSISDDDNESISESKKSVRFSIVNIREYELDGELGDDCDNDENKDANEQDQGQEEKLIKHGNQLKPGFQHHSRRRYIP